MSKPIRKKKTKEDRLVVGILTMPHAHGRSHVMRSYVEWLSPEGVTVVPVPCHTEEVELYFHVLHGLVIPGGDTEYVFKKEPAMLRTVERFLKLAMRPGEYFPIWATCLGYELMMSVVGGFRTFEKIQDQLPRRLTWTTVGERSDLYRRLGPATGEETVQNHIYGISPKRFQDNKRLRLLFQVYATTANDKGEEYVAVVQAKKWPIYGVMFHPERQWNGIAFSRAFLMEVCSCQHPRGIIKGYSWGKTGACQQYPELGNQRCYFF